MDAGDLLQVMLPMAVTMKIMDYQRLPWAQLQQIATESSQYVAEHGDDILFKSKRHGDTAKAFNALVRGLAVAAFAPGGVTLFGMHFEDVHPEIVKAGRWMYHSTFADTLPMIAKEGLQPDQKSRWGAHLVDYSQGKVFFTGLIQMAAGYADTVFKQTLEENGWSWDPVLLRAFSGHLGDMERDNPIRDDWYIERGAPAIFLQAWVPEKEAWIEIREVVAQGYFQNAKTKYGEPGKINVAPDASPADYAKTYIDQFWPKY